MQVLKKSTELLRRLRLAFSTKKIPQLNSFKKNPNEISCNYRKYQKYSLNFIETIEHHNRQIFFNGDLFAHLTTQNSEQCFNTNLKPN